MSMIDECERCLGRVDQAGDHLCAGCSKALGRSPKRPFWGSFANHPDSKLRASNELSRARDFVGLIDGMLGSAA